MADLPRPDLAAHQIAQLTQTAKRHLRQRLKGVRKGIPERAWQNRSALVCDLIVEERAWQEATSVALFWPLVALREVDLRPLDARARAAGKRVYYPFLDGTTTGFRQSLAADDVIERGSLFAEPPEGTPVAARGDIDLVLVPALGFDARGNRLGYGKGYYDVTLPDVCPPAISIIVGFDFQLLPEVPTQTDDVRCDRVFTDAGEVVPQESPPPRRALRDRDRN